MSVSAICPKVRCVPEVRRARDEQPPDITFKTKAFFSKRVDLSGEKRVIINLTDVRWDHGNVFLNIYRKVVRPKNELGKIPILLEGLGFDYESRKKIFTQFGDGDLDAGAEVFFHDFIEKGLITVERIGYSGKNADDPKFYLIINVPQEKGGNNIFYQGFSRKGTLRGITKIKQDRIKEGMVVRVTDTAQQLFTFLKLHKDDTFSFCCRVMGYESELKVSEFNGPDLFHFDIQDLSQEQRYQFYISIFEGLAQIHQFGVHGDVKPGNIVAVKNAVRVCFAKFIDFDTMQEQGKKRKGGGTLAYYSPRRLLSRILGQAFPASKKDDMWGGTVSICELEYYRISPAERILSPQFVSRVCDYHDSGDDVAARCEWIEREINRDEGNLFNRLKPDPSYPLDALVYATSFMDYPEEKIGSAEEIVMNFGKTKVSGEFTQDSIEILDSGSVNSYSANSYTI